MNNITLQQFLELVRQIAYYLIPIVGLVILIAIARILHQVINVMKTMNARVAQLEKTISLVDENLVSLSTTTKHVANVTTSLDEAHVKSKEKFSDLKSKVSTTISKAQQKSKELLSKNSSSKEVEQ